MFVRVAICLHAKYAQRFHTIHCIYKCTKCSEFDSNLNSVTPYVQCLLQYSITSVKKWMFVCVYARLQPTKHGRINEFKCAHCKLISSVCYRWNPHISPSIWRTFCSPTPTPILSLLCIIFFSTCFCLSFFSVVMFSIIVCNVMSGAMIHAQCLRSSQNKYEVHSLSTLLCAVCTVYVERWKKTGLTQEKKALFLVSTNPNINTY